jgi:4-aminobutyrate aminotransferase-like enzyme
MRAGIYANGLRFLPPLNITDDQLDEAMSVVGAAIRTVNRQMIADRQQMVLA